MPFLWSEISFRHCHFECIFRYSNKIKEFHHWSEVESELYFSQRIPYILCTGELAKPGGKRSCHLVSSPEVRIQPNSCLPDAAVAVVCLRKKMSAVKWVDEMEPSLSCLHSSTSLQMATPNDYTHLARQYPLQPAPLPQPLNPARRPVLTKDSWVFSKKTGTALQRDGAVSEHLLR